MEWTDPQYADLVAAWETSQEPDSRDPGARPVRAFIASPDPEAPQD
ncbi:hypothetical protein ACFU8Q_14495 [Streptomyces sp. NPDC057543]